MEIHTVYGAGGGHDQTFWSVKWKVCFTSESGLRAAQSRWPSRSGHLRVSRQWKQFP
jgi:hypothetical protein